MMIDYNSLKVVTDKYTKYYNLDTSGKTDISIKLQSIFDVISKEHPVGAVFTFSPGIYRFENPIKIKLACVTLKGSGHTGIDIHGLNLATGTIFHFGPKCAPNCITFDYDGPDVAFPSKKSPWPYKTSKIQIEDLSFVGYNNTDVDTDKGYSRFRGDIPNFRGLHWYPSKNRYIDPKKEGQRAIVVPKPIENSKPEMFKMRGCSFTDLYVGVDIHTCDVTHITDSWFAQMVYGIRYHDISQCMFISNNCFADLMTALKLAHPIMSTFQSNSFAYLSKCFEIELLEHSTISGNVLHNWDKSTGAAANGAFLYIGRNSKNVTISQNTINQEPDSRCKNTTVDIKPNNRAFIHFEGCQNLLFSTNTVCTNQSQAVIRLHDCKQCYVIDNIITHANTGCAVSQTGNSINNVYRSLTKIKSEPFDNHL